MPLLKTVAVQVRFGDLDPLGHVNHVQFFALMETARIEFMRGVARSLFGSMVIAHSECDHLQEIRGGTRWVDVDVSIEKVGTTSFVVLHELRVAGPRNHFEFEPLKGTRCLFVAGGIGITPLSSMVATAERAGVEWELHYAGRSRTTMALAAELESMHPGRVHLYPADEGHRLDLTSLYADLPPFTISYCCGPARLNDAVEVAARGRQLKLERFVARELGDPVRSEPFEVELAWSGTVLTVPPERSVLEVVEESGTLVLSSCQTGTCGTCETRVLDGEVDHRDSILTPDEQAANDVMYVCVSRSTGPRLVLEL